MRLDVDPFLVNTVGLEGKRILVRTDQAETTRGKNVVVSGELRNKMIKPHNPEPGVWKENTWREVTQRVKATSNMLIEKYLRQQRQHSVHWQGATSRERRAQGIRMHHPSVDTHRGSEVMVVLPEWEIGLAMGNIR
jgi:hypothetical protein